MNIVAAPFLWGFLGGVIGSLIMNVYKGWQYKRKLMVEKVIQRLSTARAGTAIFGDTLIAARPHVIGARSAGLSADHLGPPPHPPPDIRSPYNCWCGRK